MSDQTSLPPSLPSSHEDAARALDGPQQDRPAYGYGHPAHRPDPSAEYVFHPGPPRTLPLDPRRRWRTAG